MSRRRDTLKDFLAPVTEGEALARPARAPVRSGALTAMNEALAHLADDAERAGRLQAQIEAGEVIVEIDAERIRPAFIRDRLDDHGGADFAELRESLRVTGQIIPVLVRPHPEDGALYQLAFGHRRVEALRQLGRPVKAIVRMLSDDELVVAQGQENTERKDLSFIEKAFFALGLETRGISRKVILEALSSTSKGVLSGMISLARLLPADLVQAIGPAPSIGRPRWEALARAVETAGDEAAWRAAMAAETFRQASSDARFEAVFSALRSPDQRKAAAVAVHTAAGETIATARFDGRATKLVFEGEAPKAFSAYLMKRLPQLYAVFLKEEGLP